MVKPKQPLKCVLAPNAMASVLVRQARLADLVATVLVMLLAAGVFPVLEVAAIAVLELSQARTDCSPRRVKQTSAQCLTMYLLTQLGPRVLSRAVPAALVLPVAQPQPQPLR